MKKRRIACLALALAMSVSSVFAFGCGGGGGNAWGEDLDESKVQVYVGPHNGGWGQDFVGVWAAKYEDLHKDTVYNTPSGEKTGVQILYSVGSGYGGSLQSTSTSPHDIILAEVVDYKALVPKGDLVDVTSWVTKPNPYDTAGRSIESRMTAEMREYFKEVTYDRASPLRGTAYYAVPSYFASYNMYYDRDLFEDNGLFLQEVEGVLSVVRKQGYKQAVADGVLTLGPDNKTGVVDDIDYSADDGLPRTTEEFVMLFDEMITRGITPISVSGDMRFYYWQFMMNLWTQFSGFDNMMSNFDYDGEEYLVKDIASDGTPIYDSTPTKITSRNGYELQRQDGKYFALDFTEKIMSQNNNYVSTAVYKDVTKYLQSQELFLGSKPESIINPIAIHIDGSWWYQEAKAYMNYLGEEYDESYGLKQRRIGILPNPLREIGQEQALYACNMPSILVNARNIEDWRLPVVKDFFQFMLADEQLSSYSLCVNATMTYDYPLTAADKAEATLVLKDAIRQQRTYKIVTPQTPTTMVAIGAVPSGGANELSWTSVVDRKSYTDPLYDVGKGKLSAKDYFMGLRKGNLVYSADAWKDNFGTGFFN